MRCTYRIDYAVVNDIDGGGRGEVKNQCFRVLQFPTALGASSSSGIEQTLYFCYWCILTEMPNTFQASHSVL